MLELTKDTIPVTKATLTGRIVDLDLIDKKFQVEYPIWDAVTQRQLNMRMAVEYTTDYCTGRMQNLRNGCVTQLTNGFSNKRAITESPNWSSLAS